MKALLAKKDVGDNIIVIGGGVEGCETAVWLAQRGKKVTVVEILADILQEMLLANRMMLLEMLEEADVRIQTSAEVLEITDDGIVVQKKAKREILKADNIVVAIGVKSEKGLSEVLEGKRSAVHVVGDCVKPRKVIDAIWEAYRVAHVL